LNSILGLIGIAKKGGMLATGDEQTRVAARARRAKAIFTASDAAENTMRRAESLADLCGVPHIRLPADRETLANALGMRSCAIFAILNSGVAEAIIKKINP
jgi:ribosomal protein L7Ae-like RNA K-turn-binding protein